jgi:hypothetical protein
LSREAVGRLDCRTAPPHIRETRVLSVRHKGLKRLIEDDVERGIRPDLVNLTALLSAQGVE